METTTLLIQPVKISDLDAICDIAQAAGPGFTSLPNEPEVIRTKIMRSLKAFNDFHRKEDKLFFFVLEDLTANFVIETAVIEADVNHNGPFYCYHRSKILQQSHIFKDHAPIIKQNKLLFLDSPYPEASTYGTLYLHSDHRGKGYGKFISRMRSLFIAVFPDFFHSKIIANMEGYFVNNEFSPFWNALGSSFYNMDIRQANRNYSVYGSQFICELNPHYPIYEAMLPKETQEIIGKINEVTKPALHVLENEGFIKSKFIDIFDGGPIIEVNKTELKTVKESNPLSIIGLKEKCEDNTIRMICNTKLDFKATLGHIDFENEQQNRGYLEKKIAEILKVSVGATIRECVFQ